MGCKVPVLPQPLTENHHTGNCLTYEENTGKPYNVNLYLFKTLALHLHGNGGLEEETSKLFNLFLEKIGGSDAASFQCVCMDDIPIAADWVQANVFLYDIDNVHRAMAGEVLANNPTLSDNCVMTVTFAMYRISMLFSKPYRCPSSDQIIKKDWKLQRHLTTCK